MIESSQRRRGEVYGAEECDTDERAEGGTGKAQDEPALLGGSQGDAAQHDHQTSNHRRIQGD